MKLCQSQVWLFRVCLPYFQRIWNKMKKELYLENLDVSKSNSHEKVFMLLINIFSSHQKDLWDQLLLFFELFKLHHFLQVMSFFRQIGEQYLLYLNLFYKIFGVFDKFDHFEIVSYISDKWFYLISTWSIFWEIMLHFRYITDV